MKPSRLEEIFERYDGMINIYILCVDRDASPNREASLRILEDRYSRDNRVFLCVAAIEEIEAWLLAGHDLPPDWSWRDIRAHRDVKEAYFEPFAKLQKVEFSPGRGRKILGKALKGQIGRVVQRCAEELEPLIGKIQASIQ